MRHLYCNSGDIYLPGQGGQEIVNRLSMASTGVPVARVNAVWPSRHCLVLEVSP
jgi:hypothetical protein